MEAGVHVQVVTYRLAESSVSDAEFIEANQEFAEMMRAVPGLLAKIWLKNPTDEVYGGLYLWQDREAYESFLASELWGSVVSDDSVSDLTSHDFTVMDELTAETQPALQLL
jgi:Putative mono-oxygenase ydhR